MGITHGDHLIDIGHHDISPEQEREIWASEQAQRDAERLEWLSQQGVDSPKVCGWRFYLDRRSGQPVLSYGFHHGVPRSLREAIDLARLDEERGIPHGDEITRIDIW